MSSTQSTVMNPIQISYDEAVQVGYGINPISGGQTTMFISGIDALPTTSPGNENNTQTKWAFIQSQSDYSASWGIEGTISGNYETVKGSLSASYSSQEQYNSNQAVLTATCINIDGQQMIDPTQSGLDVTQVTAAIKKSGYDEFVEQYGTHFVAGIIYGSEYIASYTSSYQSSADAQSAQAALSAEYNGVVASGSISSKFTDKASSQSGFQSQSGDQDSKGAFTPVQPANIDNINTNLGDFPGSDSGLPLWYVCWDWREIPAISAVATSSAINWQEFYDNLGNVQNCLASLTFNQSSAQNATPIGATSTADLSTYITDANTAVSEIENYTPQDIANFNASTFAATVSQITSINEISNGQATIRLRATTGGAFDPNPPKAIKGQYTPSNDFVSITSKHTGGDTWAFGFKYNSPGRFGVKMGVLDKPPDTFDSSWMGKGSLTYSAENTSVVVRLDNGKYQYITARIEVT